jgi:hypothetical protein
MPGKQASQRSGKGRLARTALADNRDFHVRLSFPTEIITGDSKTTTVSQES